MSTSTGVAPTRAMLPAVAKNEYVLVMTSSPGPMPSAISTASSASVPDDTAIASPASRDTASSRSSASTSAPMMNRWLSQTRAIAARISARMGRYCASRSRSGTLFTAVGPHPHSLRLDSLRSPLDFARDDPERAQRVEGSLPRPQALFTARRAIRLRARGRGHRTMISGAPHSAMSLRGSSGTPLGLVLVLRMTSTCSPA